MEEIPTTMVVVAAALQRESGQWLMQRRPDHKHHGGLWEFPGGKVEGDESPENALIRELNEELGIAVRAGTAAFVASASSGGQGGDSTIVISLYKVVAWAGEPAPIEGGSLGWFDAHEIDALDMPPLDIVLARQLFEKEAG